MRLTRNAAHLAIGADAMPIRLRKFIGAIALFVLVVVWALLAMALAQAPAIRDNTIVSIGYYVIAGLGWVLPALPIVSWMSRRRTTEDGRQRTD
jgi:membrane protein DedA with SNARE-associated domain